MTTRVISPVEISSVIATTLPDDSLLATLISIFFQLEAIHSFQSLAAIPQSTAEAHLITVLPIAFFARSCCSTHPLFCFHFNLFMLISPTSSSPRRIAAQPICLLTERGLHRPSAT